MVYWGHRASSFDLFMRIGFRSFVMSHTRKGCILYRKLIPGANVQLRIVLSKGITNDQLDVQSPFFR